MDRLDTVLRRIGNISAMNRRRLLDKCDQFWTFEVKLIDHTLNCAGRRPVLQWKPRPMNSVRIGLRNHLNAPTVYPLYCATIFYLNYVYMLQCCMYQCATQPYLIHLSLKRLPRRQIKLYKSRWSLKKKYFI